jgi:uncharacterized protein YbaP (TraB family)
MIIFIEISSMRSSIRTVAVLTLIVASLYVSAQTTPTPKTLLWRITGKNLKQPSYLFGTMHLQDKRLFYFSDSLYAAMEKTEGFATEVDFREYMDTMVRSGFRQAEREWLKKKSVALNKQKLPPSADTLLKKFGIKGSQITKADLKRIRDYRMQQMLSKGEMPTIMDGYLSGLALRQKKWVGGIEDISDQEDVFDELDESLTPEVVLSDDRDMQKGIEWMIKTYLRADLDSMEWMSRSGDPDYRDVVLIRRNVKMARRMDSLTAIRSMLLAVGAAHLSGDSGVISLLRKRGFTVEPVISDKKIFADQYAQNLPAPDWYTFTDERNTYSIQMPAKPSPINFFGDLLPMHLCIDLSNFGFYFVGQTVGRFEDKAALRKAFGTLANNLNGEGRAIKVSDISDTAAMGMETVVKNEGMTFRVQIRNKANAVYLIMMAGLKEQTVQSPEAIRFFQSHRPMQTEGRSGSWVKFDVPGQYAAVSFPTKPSRNSRLNPEDSASLYLFHDYNAADVHSGLYFLAQVREIKPGYYIDGDSAFFENYLNEIRGQIDTITFRSDTMVQGFPAQFFDYTYRNEFHYKVLQVIRGGRIITLLVGGMKNVSLDAAQTFFSSLELQPFVHAEAKHIERQGFTVHTAAMPHGMEGDEQPKGEQQRSTMYGFTDTTQRVEFIVNRFKVPAYFWTTSDTAYLSLKLKGFVNEGDSVWYQTYTKNGGLTSLEAVIESPKNQHLQKVRLLASGDSIYSVIGFIPKLFLNDKQHNEFFESFRLVKERPTTISANKEAALFRALQSPDSATVAEGKRSIEEMMTTKADLPWLHRGILLHTETEEAKAAQDLLLDAIVSLNDTATVQFVREQYSQLPKQSEEARPRLLYLLAKHQTETSYKLLQQLLQAPLYAGGDYRNLRWAMNDSLELTAAILPSLLPLLGDTSIGSDIANLVNRCISDSLLDKSVLWVYENQILRGGKRALSIAKENPEEYWSHGNWTDLLAYLNNTKANALLQQYLSLPELSIKQDAAVLLLGNNQTVSAQQLVKLAADKGQRFNFYHQLKQIGKEPFFPVAYANQVSLAEGELYAYASDEWDVKSIQFMSTRTEKYGDTLSRFHLFKITLNTDEGPQSYLGVAGPYKPGTKQLISGDATGVYWDEILQSSRLRQQLRAYLQSF